MLCKCKSLLGGVYNAEYSGSTVCVGFSLSMRKEKNLLTGYIIPQQINCADCSQLSRSWTQEGHCAGSKQSWVLHSTRYDREKRKLTRPPRA